MTHVRVYPTYVTTLLGVETVRQSRKGHKMTVSYRYDGTPVSIFVTGRGLDITTLADDVLLQHVLTEIAAGRATYNRALDNQARDA